MAKRRVSPTDGGEGIRHAEAARGEGWPPAPEMFGMRWHWKTLWLALWLLSQTLSFALPAQSSAAEREMPPCPVWERSRAGNHGYDSGFQSWLGCDTEFPPGTTQGLGDLAGTLPTILAYDLGWVSSIRTAGAPRAPTVAEAGFVAAETGDEGQLLHYVVKETVATAGDVGTDQLAAAGVGKALGASFAFFCKLKRPAKTVAAEVTTPIGELRAAGLRDAHHVVQDSAVRDLPGYDTQLARGVQLPGPPTAVGTPHHAATRVQRQAGGGTLGAELRIGYKALRRAGCSEAEARQAIAESEAYFNSIGATRSNPTRIPGNR